MVKEYDPKEFESESTHVPIMENSPKKFFSYSLFLMSYVLTGAYLTILVINESIFQLVLFGLLYFLYLLWGVYSLMLNEYMLIKSIETSLTLADFLLQIKETIEDEKKKR